MKAAYVFIYSFLSRLHYQQALRGQGLGLALGCAAVPRAEGQHALWSYPAASASQTPAHPPPCHPFSHCWLTPYPRSQLVTAASKEGICILIVIT